MNEDLHDIEELFKSALANNRDWPTSKVWDSIANILDKDDMLRIKEKYANIKKITFLLFFSLLGVTVYEIEFHNHKSVVETVHPTKSSALNTTTTFKIKTVRNLTNFISKGNLGGNSFYKSRNSSNSARNKGDYGNFRRAVLSQNYSNRSEGANVISGREEKNTRDHLSSESINKLFASQAYSLSVLPQKETWAVPALTLKLIDSVKVNSKPSFTVTEKKTGGEVLKKKEKGRSPISVTAFFSPDFASYRLHDNDRNILGYDAGETEQDENHEFSSTIGAMVEYGFKKHLSIEAGLTFSNTNITVAPRMIYAEAANSGDIKYRLNTSSGYGYVLPSFSRTPNVGDSLYAFTSTHTLQYLSLPAQLKANARFRKFEFDVMTGAVVNFLIRGRIETSIENGADDEPEVSGKLYGLKKVYFSGLAGVGVSYQINERIAISLSPTFRYAINSINKNTPVKSYPNSLMFPIGIKIQL